MIGLLLFALALILLLTGYPVAFVLGSSALIMALLTDNLHLFGMMPYRIYAIMTNITLMAVPLFIYMGVVLEKSGLAEQMLVSMGKLFGRLRGGLAIATILVGTLMAAATGVVGASVVAMAIISLPVMLKRRYNPALAAGTICAAGTLGQIIPPSIVLIILGEVLQISVGDLFQAALLPGLLLSGSYIAYIVFRVLFSPQQAPALPETEGFSLRLFLHTAGTLFPTLLLIVLVLGSIFAGIATPTESAAVGAVGSVLLSFAYRRGSWHLIWTAAKETAHITSMVFLVLIGATAFSMVFSYTGGEALVKDFFLNAPGGIWGFLFLSMLLIFLLGFFLDFVEISTIVVPILYAVAQQYGIDPLWFGILIALNLQSSFLTPPFGFSLFYLKGVAKDLPTSTIYRGVVPFIILQLVVLAIFLLLPQWFGFAPPG